MIFLRNKLFLGLCLIFLIGVVIRFLFFPDNIYFGFDQARDAYSSQEIFRGNLKIVGPPTSGNLFHHGVLYYYIFGPIYTFFDGNPEAVAGFLRIFNTLGIFIVFAISVIMFDLTVGIFAALLFAFSYEQTQFALFMNHPSFAVISVLMFYFGLSYWVFKRKSIGIIISLFALGISVQFEFVELQLIPIFIIFLIYFRDRLKLFLTSKNIILSIFALAIPFSTFLIFEIKNNFYTIKSLPLFVIGESGSAQISLAKFLFFINRFFEDNILFMQPFASIIGILFLIISMKLVLNKAYKDKIIFLLLWFFGGFLIYFMTNDDAYFYNTGTSISLLIFTAFVLSKIYQKYKIVASILLIIIIGSNLYLITKNNIFGPNQKINPQVGLLLTDEKKVIDFIYLKSNREMFAVNALTMPLNINTTWDYLFNWYGKRKYGYVPVWGGNAALGYYGNLKIETARSKLPYNRFLIIEPKEGIPSYLISNFLETESLYAIYIEKKKIGAFEVWVGVQK